MVQTFSVREKIVNRSYQNFWFSSLTHIFVISTALPLFSLHYKYNRKVRVLQDALCTCYIIEKQISLLFDLVCSHVKPSYDITLTSL